MSDSSHSQADPGALALIQPEAEADWTAYFDLRWRVLRQPWNQPRGSERDDSDASSCHLMLRAADGSARAVGRLHLNSPREAQVRYMAVDPAFQGQGLGSRILRNLEARARALAASDMVLNAREDAIAFYIRHGYAVSGPAHTLFGQVRHERMRKALSAANESTH
jgi:ribosomal protein S18 acetylase RimI-like enzyme